MQSESCPHDKFVDVGASHSSPQSHSNAGSVCPRYLLKYMQSSMTANFDVASSYRSGSSRKSLGGRTATLCAFLGFDGRDISCLMAISIGGGSLVDEGVPLPAFIDVNEESLREREIGESECGLRYMVGEGPWLGVAPRLVPSCFGRSKDRDIVMVGKSVMIS
jgi:hypothetical protein